MSDYQQVHERVVGDTLTPLGAQLQQNCQPVDLTNKSVEFKMVANDGTVKRDWITADVVDALTGKVQYDFQVTDVNTAGVYWAWFRTKGSGDETGEVDTYPPAGSGSKARRFKIVINEAA